MPQEFRLRLVPAGRLQSCYPGFPDRSRCRCARHGSGAGRRCGDKAAQAQFADDFGEAAQRHLATAARRGSWRVPPDAGGRLGVMQGRQQWPSSSRPARHSMPSAPWPTAGRLCSGSISARMRCAQLQPFQAGRGQDDGGELPSSSLRRRVCTLPRSGSIFRWGKRARNWHSRRRLEVPTTLPAAALQDS